MICRRSLFSVFAGFAAIISAAKVVEAKSVDIKWVPVSDPTPRPSHYSTGITDGAHTHANTLNDPCHTHCMNWTTGEAVNLRSDGTLRHRQHHPTNFPPHGNQD